MAAFPAVSFVSTSSRKCGTDPTLLQIDCQTSQAADRGASSHTRRPAEDADQATGQQADCRTNRSAVGFLLDLDLSFPVFDDNGFCIERYVAVPV